MTAEGIELKTAANGRILAADALVTALGDPEGQLPKLANVLREQDIA